MHTGASSTTLLVLAVFAASAVEMVEALTIVLASGTTRGWRSALEGTAAALVCLAALVGAFGLSVVRYVPLGALRVVVGALLLVMGLSWLRKAVLRASGLKAPHDEDAIFTETTDRLRRTPADGHHHRDRVGFAVAFKGVFLEGVEVALIVVSLGGAQHRLGLAAVAAGAAVVVVAAVGLVVARQLSRVPENLIKTAVGVMLTSFGVFWVGEGAGIGWPGTDTAIPVLVGVFVAATVATVARLRRRLQPAPDGPATAETASTGTATIGTATSSRTAPVGGRTTARRALEAAGAFCWDLVIGDTPEIPLATLAIVALAFALRHNQVAGTLALPAMAVASLVLSAYRGRRRSASPARILAPAEGL